MTGRPAAPNGKDPAMKTASHAALCRPLAVLCLVFALCLAWPVRASANSAGLPELRVQAWLPV